MLVDCLVAYIALVKLHVMISRGDTSISSIEKSYDGKEVTKFIDLGSKFVFFINKGGDDPWDDIPFEGDARKYVHVEFENLYENETLDEDEEEMEFTTTHYPVKCSNNYLTTKYE